MPRRKQNQRDTGKWVVGLTENDGDLYSLRFDRQFDLPLPGFAHQIVIDVELHDPNDNGLTTSDESDALALFDDRINDAAAGGAVLVGTLTGKAHKHHILYAMDLEWLAPWRESEQGTAYAHNFEVRIKEDSDWSLYRRMLPEAERADADRRILDQLASHGAHLDEPRNIDWYFRFPDADRARSAQQVLFDHEYRVETGERDTEWSVVASLTKTISLRYVIHMSAMLSSFALDQGGTYDGWGADVDP
jgi:hypothetical protein